MLAYSTELTRMQFLANNDLAALKLCPVRLESFKTGIKQFKRLLRGTNGQLIPSPYLQVKSYNPWLHAAISVAGQKDNPSEVCGSDGSPVFTILKKKNKEGEEVMQLKLVGIISEQTPGAMGAGVMPVKMQDFACGKTNDWITHALSNNMERANLLAFPGINRMFEQRSKYLEFANSFMTPP